MTPQERHLLFRSELLPWLRIVAAVAETLLAVMFVAAGIYVSFAYFDVDPPISFLDGPGQHVRTTDDGRSFIVHRHSCLHRVKPGTAVVRLAGIGNKLLVPLPSKTYNAVAKPGTCSEIDVMVFLPEEVPAGEYMYLIKYQFTINAFRTLEIEAAPVWVTVKK